MNRPAVSALVLTHNESQSIERCLNSVAWADEIVIIDDFSDDGTMEICAMRQAKIVQRKYDYYGSQSAFGLQHCSHEWVYQIDADEECSEELAKEMQEALSRETSCDAFSMYIRPVFMNRPIRYGAWGNKKRVRLFKKEFARFEGPMNHESVKVPGKTSGLKGYYYHYTYSTMDLWIRKQLSYSVYGAETAYQRGDAAGFVNLFLHPLFYFLNSYLRRFGFLDGMPGLIASLSGAATIYFRYCYLRERYEKEGKYSY